MDKLLINYRNTLLNDLFKTATDTYLNTTKISESKYNIKTYSDKYVIYFSLPGVSNSEVDVNANKDEITIKVKQHKDKPCYFVDDFIEYFSIPNDVEINEINGTIKNGLLEVYLPKIKHKEEKVTSKKIEIK